MSKALDIASYSISNLPHSAQHSFALFISVIDSFNKNLFTCNRNLLERYIDFVFSDTKIHQYLLYHVDTALLWMDHPTISPNKSFCEAIFQNIKSIFKILKKSIELNLNNENKKFNYCILKQNSSLELVIESFTTFLNRFNKIIALSDSNSWLKKFKYICLQQFPVYTLFLFLLYSVIIFIDLLIC